MMAELIFGSQSRQSLHDLNKVELESGDTVRMIWESGDTSTPLVEYEIK